MQGKRALFCRRLMIKRLPVEEEGDVKDITNVKFIE
jgi:hypothetical protein